MDQSLMYITGAALSTFILVGILEFIDRFYKRKYNVHISESNNNIVNIIIATLFVCIVVSVAIGYTYICIYAFT